MDAAEEGAAAGDALGLEADGFIGPARPRIFREYAEPDAMGIGLAEDGVDHGAEQTPADAVARPRHYDPLHAGRALRRGPIAHDREGDRATCFASDEIGIVAVVECGEMSCFVPAADKCVIAVGPLGASIERGTAAFLRITS